MCDPARSLLRTDQIMFHLWWLISDRKSVFCYVTVALAAECSFPLLSIMIAADFCNCLFNQQLETLYVHTNSHRDCFCPVKHSTWLEIMEVLSEVPRSHIWAKVKISNVVSKVQVKVKYKYINIYLDAVYYGSTEHLPGWLSVLIFNSWFVFVSFSK